jgi:ribosomal-protein-alanine N-acetyltransferase
MNDKSRKNRQQPFTAVWEFRVKPGKQRAFEKAYGPEGDWVQLFRRSEDYLGTELIRDRDLRLRYVTLDHWSSRQAYLRFQKENRPAYHALDAECEALTTREKRIGEFDRFESKENAELAERAVRVGALRRQKRAQEKQNPPCAASEVWIRPATAADIGGMIALERDSHSAAHWTEPTYGRIFSPDLAPRIALVVEDQDALVRGFAVARVVGEEVEIENIVVDRKRRHQGLGTKLLEKMIERSRSGNASRLFLEVRESNPAARALYEKCGFVLSGRRRAYYTSPREDAVLYTRKL